jgi:hypothetical protein
MSQKTLTGKYEVQELTGAISAHQSQGILFVGTAPRGIVYSTRDGFAWEEFWETGERIVTAIGSYANALFVGTGPEGKIYMHNFSTGNRFHYVTTGDYEIASFVEHDGKLYAMTSPSGMIFSFDGDIWRKEYEAFMAGTELVSDGTSLYATFSNGFSILTLDSSGEWKFASDSNGPISIASARAVTPSLADLARNDHFDHGASHAAIYGGKLYFAGSRTSTLYSFDGANLDVAYQFAGSTISGIQVAGSQIFVSAGDVVYEYTDPALSESESESESSDSGTEENSDGE